jgi:serine/threonine-protein kinase RsbW
MSGRELRMEIRTAHSGDVVALVERFGLDHALPQAVLDDVNVALDEAVSNVVSYGYDAGASGEIIIRLNYARDEVQVEVEDDGRAFDPLQVAPPNLAAPLQRRQVGGLGVHLMRSLMDVLSYDHNGGKNRLRMIKKVSRDGAGEREQHMEAASQAHDVAIVEPQGRIDSASAAAFSGQIDALIQAGSRNLLIDLRNVPYLSSAGFRALLIARKHLDATGGKLILCGVTPPLRRLFEVAHFTDLFVICATREQGLAQAR